MLHKVISNTNRAYTCAGGWREDQLELLLQTFIALKKLWVTFWFNKYYWISADIFHVYFISTRFTQICNKILLIVINSLQIACISDDIDKGVLTSNSPKPGKEGLLQLLDSRNTRVVTFDAWEKIDLEERRLGNLRNRPREKLTSWEELLKVAFEWDIFRLQKQNVRHQQISLVTIGMKRIHGDLIRYPVTSSLSLSHIHTQLRVIFWTRLLKQFISSLDTDTEAERYNHASFIWSWRYTHHTFVWDGSLLNDGFFTRLDYVSSTVIGWIKPWLIENG